MRKPRKKIPLPWSEMSFADRVREAKAALARIEDQLNLEYRNPNRSHVVTTNLYDMQKRWNNTLTMLRNDPQIHNLKFEDR